MGASYSGAAATFRVLRGVPGRGAWWWLYAHVPGFAPVSEWAYAFFARRRGLLDLVSKILWGPKLEPERYELVCWVFLRLFGAIYVAAFTSLAVQIEGLVGQAGILPVAGLPRRGAPRARRRRVSDRSHALLAERERRRACSPAPSPARCWDCWSSSTAGRGPR